MGQLVGAVVAPRLPVWVGFLHLCNLGTPLAHEGLVTYGTLVTVLGAWCTSYGYKV